MNLKSCPYIIVLVLPNIKNKNKTDNQKKKNKVLSLKKKKIINKVLSLFLEVSITKALPSKHLLREKADMRDALNSAVAFKE